MFVASPIVLAPIHILVRVFNVLFIFQYYWNIGTSDFYRKRPPLLERKVTISQSNVWLISRCNLAPACHKYPSRHANNYWTKLWGEGCWLEYSCPTVPPPPTFQQMSLCLFNGIRVTHRTNNIGRLMLTFLWDNSSTHGKSTRFSKTIELLQYLY